MKVSKIFMIEVSKDAKSEMFEGCSIVLEVWTILRQSEADLETV